MIEINTNNPVIYPHSLPTRPAKVWTRDRWSDAWTERPDLIPLQSTWKAGSVGQPSTATLHYRYGDVLLPRATEYVELPPTTTRGYFVLIAWATDDGNPIYWVGFAESAVTASYTPARDGLPETGIQTIPCFDLFRSLQESFITSTIHKDPADPSKVKRTFGGGVFNADSQGNRSKEKIDGTYVFANPSEDADRWSTRDIFEHIFKWHLPTPEQTAKAGSILWELNDLAVLPDWDRPTVMTDGRSVAEIVRQMLTPDRMLNFGIGFTGEMTTIDDPPTIDSLVIQPFTHLEADLDLGGFTLPANSRLTTVSTLGDPLSQTTVTEDDSDVHDQLIVRGPREIAVGTVRFNPILENDWESEIETKYTEGASNDAAYGGLKQHEKRERNDAVRQSGQLTKVFRVVRFKDDWDGETDSEEPFFWPIPAEDEMDPPITYVPFQGNCDLESVLPLYREVDYSGDLASVDETKGKTRRPLWFALDNPNSGLLEDMSHIGNLRYGFACAQAAIAPFEINPSVNNDKGLRIVLDVSGGPQHAIAGSAFTGTDVDAEQSKFGDYDYKTLACTLAIRGDRRPFVTLPDDSALTDFDVVRRKIVDIDIPDLELVYISKDTVIGIKEDLSVDTCDGGILRDPMPRLQAIAAMLGRHYLQPRRRMEFETQRRLSNFSVGSMITQTSGAESPVNAPVLQIEIESPLVTDGEVPDPETMRVIAASSPVDIMALLAPLESVEEEVLP